jgi:hypothetical protein
MRNTFLGYYRPTEQEFKELWSNCTFVLDANVLLNLYRYSAQTAEELFKILEKVADRIWLSHQAAFEYQERRIEVIAEQEQSYTSLLEYIEKAFEEIKGRLFSRKHPFIGNADNHIKKLNKLVSELKNNLSKSKDACLSITGEDSIRDRLTILFNGKVGAPYAEERVREIHQRGKKRYEQKIPPGFEDKKNKDNGREYGDLILWFQTLDFARESKKPIILITDEKKGDWWQKIKQKIIRPRPELIKEMREYSNVSFYMYRADRFMELAEKYLEQRVKQEAISEVRETGDRDDDAQTIRLRDLLEPPPPGALTELLKRENELRHLLKPFSPGLLTELAENKRWLEDFSNQNLLRELAKVRQTSLGYLDAGGILQQLFDQSSELAEHRKWLKDICNQDFLSETPKEHAVIEQSNNNDTNSSQEDSEPRNSEKPKK